MTAKRIVLVDGVAAYWGGRVTTLLSGRPDLHVLGLDDNPPEKKNMDLDFIQADIFNPLLAELLREERVDTVCHLTFAETARPKEDSFDLNVIGTMEVMGACAEAGVRKVTLMSSSLVYGALLMNSTYLGEEQPLNGSKAYGYLRDQVEVESFVKDFRGHYPEMLITCLRFAHIVGPKAATPMTRFLREEEAFVLLGFDPLMQLIHEEDAASALVHAVLEDVPGVFNVAADGVIPLWKLMGLAGKISAPIFHPIAYLAVSVLGPRYAPIDLDYLRYPCVGDLARMHEGLGFVPKYTAEETLREFARQQRLRRYTVDSMARALDEERLRDTIERRRGLRQQAAAAEKRARKLRAAQKRALRRITTKGIVPAPPEQKEDHK
jgi:UDP-glucose 4-epimerase